MPIPKVLFRIPKNKLIGGASCTATRPSATVLHYLISRTELSSFWTKNHV